MLCSDITQLNIVFSIISLSYDVWRSGWAIICYATAVGSWFRSPQQIFVWPANSRSGFQFRHDTRFIPRVRNTKKICFLVRLLCCYYQLNNPFDLPLACFNKETV